MSLPERLVHWAKEAKRRRVYTSAVAYIVVAVTVMELSGNIFSALDLPPWSSRLVVILLMLGFPVVVVMAWVFDITAGGVKRTEAGGSTAAAGHPRGSPVRAARRVHGGPRTAAALPAATSEPPAPPPELEPAEPPDADRVKRAAIGHVRHELKTPINGILGYSEMLLEDLEDEDREELAPDLENIRKGGRELLRLIDTTLDPDRIEQAVDIDLDEYGRQIRADLRNPINAVIGYAELLIETVEESDRPQYVSDLQRIRTAAMRLLELSTDLVEVATSHDPSLADRGRLGEASSLAHTVLSKAGRAAGPAEDGTGSLLVVDDNGSNRELLSRQLARAGFMVEVASDGPSALDRLAERSFDLVLLDVIMPEMDGLEVLRRIKSDPHLARTPVIMLSSLDDVESALRCIDLGAEDFLHKPFHPTLLRARIGASLELRRVRNESDEHRNGLVGGLTRTMIRGAFPDAIAERVGAGEETILETFGEATVLWCDVEAAARNRTRDVGLIATRTQMLVSTLEAVAERHDIETVSARGEGVSLVGGVPTPSPDHVLAAAEAALELGAILAQAPEFDAPVRLGLDSGEVTGGVFGHERKTYRLWGEPMEVARLLGAQAATGTILVSPNAHRLLSGRYRFSKGSVHDLPGRGQMKIYSLEGPA